MAYPKRAPPLAATMQAMTTYGVVRPAYFLAGPGPTAMPPASSPQLWKKGVERSEGVIKVHERLKCEDLLDRTVSPGKPYGPVLTPAPTPTFLHLIEDNLSLRANAFNSRSAQAVSVQHHLAECIYSMHVSPLP